MSKREKTIVDNMEIGRKYYLKKGDMKNGDESKILLKKKYIHNRDQGSLEPSYELTFEGVGETITRNWNSSYDMDTTYEIPKEGDIFIKNIDGIKYKITKITDNDEGRLYTLKNNNHLFETNVLDINFYKNFTSQKQIFETNFANNYPELKSNYNAGVGTNVGGKKRKSRKQKKSLKRKSRKQKKSLKKRR